MSKCIVVTNRKLCKEDFLQRIRLLVECRVDRIVLREKDLSCQEYEALARAVLAICQRSHTKCVLHKYVSVAHNLLADAIHLSVEDALEYKEQFSEFACKGISTHSVEQLLQAQKLSTDYVFYGHVYQTDCKKGLPPRGIAGLQEICKKAKVPVYAIGGISKDNVKEVLSAGASGVCVMSFGMQAEKKEIMEFVNLLKED